MFIQPFKNKNNNSEDNENREFNKTKSYTDTINRIKSLL
jgi:hypothetical protein